MDSNLANFEATVAVGSILEFLLVTKARVGYGEHFKFHKLHLVQCLYAIALRHCSGEVENVYMILQQTDSGNGVPNFVSIA